MRGAPRQTAATRPCRCVCCLKSIADYEHSDSSNCDMHVWAQQGGFGAQLGKASRGRAAAKKTRQTTTSSGRSAVGHRPQQRQGASTTGHDHGYSSRPPFLKLPDRIAFDHHILPPGPHIDQGTAWQISFVPSCFLTWLYRSGSSPIRRPHKQPLLSTENTFHINQTHGPAWRRRVRGGSMGGSGRGLNNLGCCCVSAAAAAAAAASGSA